MALTAPLASLLALLAAIIVSCTSRINVGASLVDVSPLSTLGALCVAAVPDPSASVSSVTDTHFGVTAEG